MTFSWLCRDDDDGYWFKVPSEYNNKTTKKIFIILLIIIITVIIILGPIGMDTLSRFPGFQSTQQIRCSSFLSGIPSWFLSLFCRYSFFDDGPGPHSSLTIKNWISPHRPFVLKRLLILAKLKSRKRYHWN